MPTVSVNRSPSRSRLGQPPLLSSSKSRPPRHRSSSNPSKSAVLGFGMEPAFSAAQTNAFRSSIAKRSKTASGQDVESQDMMMDCDYEHTPGREDTSRGEAAWSEDTAMDLDDSSPSSSYNQSQPQPQPTYHETQYINVTPPEQGPYTPEASQSSQVSPFCWVVANCRSPERFVT